MILTPLVHVAWFIRMEQCVQPSNISIDQRYCYQDERSQTMDKELSAWNNFLLAKRDGSHAGCVQASTSPPNRTRAGVPGSVSQVGDTNMSECIISADSNHFNCIAIKLLEAKTESHPESNTVYRSLG
jgi:hypothetical protein